MTIVKISGFGKLGFIADLPDYNLPPEAWTEVKNVRFNARGAVAFPGHVSVLSAAAFEPLWLRVFPPVEAPIWVYAGLNQVGAFDAGHFDISRVTTPYNAIPSERWQGEVFQGLGIFNNTQDIPQLWNQFRSDTRLVDLPNWPADLRCKFLRPFKNFLMAGYMIEAGEERPYRFRWSDPAAPGTIPASWALNDPTKDSGEVDIAETPDYLVDGLTLGDLFIIYKQRSFYAAQYVGRPYIFDIRPISYNKGAITRDCISSFPGGHFVAGIDDIYMHTGQKGSERSLVETTLREWIFKQIETTNFQNCYTVNYQRVNEMWFCFPEAGETYPTLAAVWNMTSGGVGIRELQKSPFIWPGPVDPSIEEDTWDNVFYVLVEDGENLVQEDLMLILAE